MVTPLRHPGPPEGCRYSIMADKRGGTHCREDSSGEPVMRSGLGVFLGGLVAVVVCQVGAIIGLLTVYGQGRCRRR
jgi:hypothetical protein